MADIAQVLFDKIDNDKSGTITESEWMEFYKAKQPDKEGILGKDDFDQILGQDSSKLYNLVNKTVSNESLGTTENTSGQADLGVSSQDWRLFFLEYCDGPHGNKKITLELVRNAIGSGKNIASETSGILSSTTGAITNGVGAIGNVASTGVGAVGSVASTGVGAIGNVASTGVGAVTGVIGALNPFKGGKRSKKLRGRKQSGRKSHRNTRKSRKH